MMKGVNKMAINRYVFVSELKPEHVEDYKNLHKTCMKTKFNGQPQAMIDSGAIETLVYVFKNYSIVYIETELTLDEVFAKLGKTKSNQIWQEQANPCFAVHKTFDGEKQAQYLEKIFDSTQMAKGEFTPL